MAVVAVMLAFLGGGGVSAVFVRRAVVATLVPGTGPVVAAVFARGAVVPAAAAVALTLVAPVPFVV